MDRAPVLEAGTVGSRYSAVDGGRSERGGVLTLGAAAPLMLSLMRASRRGGSNAGVVGCRYPPPRSRSLSSVPGLFVLGRVLHVVS